MECEERTHSVVDSVTVAAEPRNNVHVILDETIIHVSLERISGKHFPQYDIYFLLNGKYV